MEVFVVVAILLLGLAGALFLMSRAKDNQGLVEQVGIMSEDSAAIKADIAKMRVDIQTIFDEHTGEIEALKQRKPASQRVVVKHLFPNAVPVSIVSNALPSVPKKVPQAPKSLMQKAGLKKSQMKGL